MGAGTDSGTVSPLNPWLSIEFMVTGKNAAGDVLIPGQQISRLDALRLYTAANAWFTFEEDELGSLEAGKFADLTVIDRPYLSIDTEEIREITSLMTMVNGNIVHARGAYFPSGQTIALIPHRRHSPKRSTSDVDLSQNQSCDQMHLSFSEMDIPGLRQQQDRDAAIGDCVAVNPSSIGLHTKHPSPMR